MVVENTDVVVLGAGASGLMCAITAAKRGRKVVVLEKANKIGKKILMSGGGRCNFTNYVVEPDHFLSDNPHFCKSSLARYTQWDFIAMVDQYQIEFEERKHSQLFCKNSAKDILMMLIRECEIAGVEIRSNCNVSGIKEAKPSGYQVVTEQGGAEGAIASQSLVVATGALSIPTLGGSGFGYDIAKQFGLSVTPLQAGLVPFTISDSMKAMCERLAGLSVLAEVYCNQGSFRENILFTHRGLSGPAILQVSNYWQLGNVVHVNLLPDLDVCSWLLEKKTTAPKSQLKTVLCGELPKALVLELLNLWCPEDSSMPMADLSDKSLSRLGGFFNDWCIKPSGTEGYRTAEVTLGGVDTSGVSSKTMEAKAQAGLYFIGEVLDVTGHLGGFNFQWAWSSGYAAGSFA